MLFRSVKGRPIHTIRTRHVYFYTYIDRQAAYIACRPCSCQLRLCAQPLTVSSKATCHAPVMPRCIGFQIARNNIAVKFQLVAKMDEAQLSDCLRYIAFEEVRVSHREHHVEDRRAMRKKALQWTGSLRCVGRSAWTLPAVPELVAF